MTLDRPGPEAADDIFAELGDIVRDAMARWRVPGVAVGILHQGQEHLAGFGVTNVNHPLPVDPDTLFQIGSISKTICGTAAMRLVDEGQLDLDAPVRTYLPELRLADESVAARVTLRHLFTHTAGWLGDFFEHTGTGADALARVVAKLATVPQVAPLGAYFSYSNSGFLVAGRVIEVVTGRPYERVLRDLVLRPLGMTLSFFRHFATEFIVHRVAVGHAVKDGRLVVVRPYARSRSAAPSGGIVSTARDLLRYARFHLGDGRGPDGTRLLRPETLAAMQTPLVPTDGSGGAVGITWMLGQVGGTRLVRHGGSTFGQRAALVLAPERDFALVVLTNAEGGEALHREVVRWALARYLGAVEPPPVLLDLPASTLAAYVGRYTAALADVVIGRRAGGLWLREISQTGDRGDEAAASALRVGLIALDRGIVLDPPSDGLRVEFLRQPDGGIAWLRFGGRLYAPVPPTEVASDDLSPLSQG